MTSVKQLRFLFAGGGTGGHLFPAVAVAEKIREKQPDARILFIGTKSKIEGRIVPKLGFEFKSIWIKGFARKMNLENLIFPLKVIVSLLQSLLINIRYRPHVAIGSGGYVSGPAVYASAMLGAKVILLEQNSYPGITTRLLEKKAEEIHLTFEDSKKYLSRKEILKVTGNPVRQSLAGINKSNALGKYNFTADKKTLLVLGGSLGAASINRAVADNLEALKKLNLQIIWQCGKNYYEKYAGLNAEGVHVTGFIDDMNYAYSASDIMLARAGATTISELLYLGIPSVLVPSPHVAANHQYFNAKSLADEHAAVMMDDNEVGSKIVEIIAGLLNNKSRLEELKLNALRLSKPEAAEVIAGNAINYCKEKI